MLVKELIDYLKELPDEQKEYDITIFDLNFKHTGLHSHANGMFKHISFMGDYNRSLPMKQKRKRKEVQND